MEGMKMNEIDELLGVRYPIINEKEIF